MYFPARSGLAVACSVAMAACGSATVGSIVNPTPILAPVATTTDTLCTAGDIPTTFCLTPAQKAAGEAAIHFTAIPDSFFLRQGALFTIASSDTARVSQEEAETIALKRAQIKDPVAQIDQAILVEWHDLDGTGPVHGQLTWVVNVTPPGGVPGAYLPLVPIGGSTPGGALATKSGTAYEVVTINALTGAVTAIMYPNLTINFG